MGEAQVRRGPDAVRARNAVPPHEIGVADRGVRVDRIVIDPHENTLHHWRSLFNKHVRVRVDWPHGKVPQLRLQTKECLRAALEDRVGAQRIFFAASLAGDSSDRGIIESLEQYQMALSVRSGNVIDGKRQRSPFSHACDALRYASVLIWPELMPHGDTKIEPQPLKPNR